MFLQSCGGCSGRRGGCGAYAVLRASPAARATVVLCSAPTSTRGRRASGHPVREAPAGRCCGDACRGESCVHRVPAVPVPSLPTARGRECVLLIGTRLSLSVPGMGVSPIMRLYARRAHGSTCVVICGPARRDHSAEAHCEMCRAFVCATPFRPRRRSSTCLRMP